MHSCTPMGSNDVHDAAIIKRTINICFQNFKNAMFLLSTPTQSENNIQSWD